MTIHHVLLRGWLFSRRDMGPLPIPAGHSTPNSALTVCSSSSWDGSVPQSVNGIMTFDRFVEPGLLGIAVLLRRGIFQFRFVAF
ncbi:hypothetical protein CEXT_201741 [Caerostris extrusa]|uniref:Uncharacterized protein n=1 Tax=Caerostris extrusa TaxID=172846 RepID=A0AAV4QWW4_CAEEX|nr:hypothetical protein CEXT_201741 [Caerostris extrusa]